MPFRSVADVRGHFGPFGGRFVPETLIPALDELSAQYDAVKAAPAFQAEFAYHLREFVGRPTPLTFAENMTRELGGAKIYLKREDLAHTGAHKINNTIGQILLAQPDGQAAHHRRGRGRGSTALRRRPSAPSSASSASCIWAS